MSLPQTCQAGSSLHLSPFRLAVELRSQQVLTRSRLSPSTNIGDTFFFVLNQKACLPIRYMEISIKTLSTSIYTKILQAITMQEVSAAHKLVRTMIPPLSPVAASALLIPSVVRRRTLITFRPIAHVASAVCRSGTTRAIRHHRFGVKLCTYAVRLRASRPT